ncbi:hypothetical protein Tco_0122079 [Tanacetum coccineum]
MTMDKENMKEPVPCDLPRTPFLEHLKKQMGSPYRTHETIRMIGNPKEIHNEKAQEDERNMDVGWDITSKDIVHITPPGDDHVAPVTNPMSNKQLNNFEEEFSNITKVVKKEHDNPVIKTYDYETFIRKLLHQVCSLEALMRLNSSTWATKWFKRLVAYAKCNRDSYKSELGDKELARRQK